MLTTAQPKGRRYCTLHWFFFSPAPILPAQRAQKNKPLGKISPSSWQDLKRKSYLFVLCARQCRRLFLDRCCPDPEETREAFKRIESRDQARVHHQHSIVFLCETQKSTLTTNSVHCLSVFSGDLGSPLLFSLTKNLSLCAREGRQRTHS